MKELNGRNFITSINKENKVDDINYLPSIVKDLLLVILVHGIHGPEIMEAIKKDHFIPTVNWKWPGASH